MERVTEVPSDTVTNTGQHGKSVKVFSIMVGVMGGRSRHLMVLVLAVASVGAQKKFSEKVLKKTTTEKSKLSGE